MFRRVCVALKWTFHGPQNRSGFDWLSTLTWKPNTVISSRSNFYPNKNEPSPNRMPLYCQDWVVHFCMDWKKKTTKIEFAFSFLSLIKKRMLSSFIYSGTINFRYDKRISDMMVLAQNIILSLTDNWIDLVTFRSIFFSLALGTFQSKQLGRLILFFSAEKHCFQKTPMKYWLHFGHFDIKQK